ncbi:hypothetical protein BLOT_000161 [Blomia tropicalis]|nr:hypothetical protein BLOT_000161 [Blomia tropicalis]
MKTERDSMAPMDHNKIMIGLPSGKQMNGEKKAMIMQTSQDFPANIARGYLLNGKKFYFTALKQQMTMKGTCTDNTIMNVLISDCTNPVILASVVTVGNVSFEYIHSTQDGCFFYCHLFCIKLLCNRIQIKFYIYERVEFCIQSQTGTHSLFSLNLYLVHPNHHHYPKSTYLSGDSD